MTTEGHIVWLPAAVLAAKFLLARGIDTYVEIGDH